MKKKMKSEKRPTIITTHHKEKHKRYYRCGNISISKAFHVLLLIIGSVDTERKQKEPYITTTFIKRH